MVVYFLIKSFLNDEIFSGVFSISGITFVTLLCTYLVLGHFFHGIFSSQQMQ